MRIKKIIINLLIVAFIMSQPILVNAKSEINVVFIIDTSGSMGEDITDVKDQIGNFTDQLKEKNITYKLGLITYETDTKRYAMTSDVTTFKNYLSKIVVSGGTENGLDAIYEAINNYTYSYNAAKYFVLIGDEKIYSKNSYSESTIKTSLTDNDIILTAVGVSSIETQFKGIAEYTGGQYLSLNSGFSTNLDEIFNQIQAIPVINILSPTENQILSDFDNAFIPTVTVTDPDSDNLTFSLFIDSESSARQTMTLSNTKTAQNVSFNAINISTLTEGDHTFKFVVNDGTDTVQDIVNFKVDKSIPLIQSSNFGSSDTEIFVSGTATDSISGLHNQPYKFILDNIESSWGDDSSHTFRNLIPNTNYIATFNVRDGVGHISSKDKIIYTKAQMPTIELTNIMSTSIDIELKDNNPSTTMYQIMCGSNYVDSTGNLKTEPKWILPSYKKITVKGLKQNTSYQFKAKSKNLENIETSFSSIKNCITVIDPPGNITLTPAQTSITANWTAVTGAAGYDIEVNGAVKNNGTSTKYTDSLLTPETQHSYRVRVKNAGGTGKWSSIFTTSTLPYPPTVLTNINTSTQKTSIKLTWDMDARATSYEIKVNNTNTYTVTTNEFTHTGLSPNTEYKYAIRAKNVGGESNWSNEITVKTLPDPPPIPQNLRAEKTKNSVTLTWEKSQGAAKYIVEVVSSNKQIIDNGENTTFLHEGLTPLTGYTYRVRAQNSGGTSNWSVPLSVTTHPEIPVMPSNIMSTSEEEAITLTWYNVQDAESYDVEIDSKTIVNTTDTSYIHNGLTADTRHTYRVRAKNISGDGLWSKPITMYTMPEISYGGDDGGSSGGDSSNKEIALSNVAAIVTNNSITISWDAAEYEAEYYVEVDGELIDNGKNTIYNHTNLEPEIYHIYKIRIKDDKYDDRWCAVLALSTLPDPPDAPDEIETFATNNSIELRWTKADGAQYDIEVDGNVVENQSAAYYLHSPLEAGTSHTYRVRAKNITGVTAWSDAIIKSTTNPTYTLQSKKGQEFDLSLMASGVQDFTELKFKVTYNPNELEVVDLYGFTPERDIAGEGKIEGTNLSVVYSEGSIVFTVNESIVPGTAWSGEITDLVFKSKTDSETYIDFVVE